MKIPRLSNNIKNENVILWQYDKAVNLIALIGKWNDLSTLSVTEFWNYLQDKVFNLSRADDFGLMVLGNLLGVYWPKIKPHGEQRRKLDREVYRHLLRGKFFLYYVASTVQNYDKYLSLVFPGATEKDRRCFAIDKIDMSAGFSFPIDASEDEAYLILQHPDLVYIYPAGINTNRVYRNHSLSFGFAGQSLNNFAEGYARAKDTSQNGGIFAGTDKAGQYDDPIIKGFSNVVRVPASTKKIPRLDSKTINAIFTVTMQSSSPTKIWVEYGDGTSDGGYVEVTGTQTFSHTYTHSGTIDGLFAAKFFCGANNGIARVTVSPESAVVETYQLD